MEELTTKTKGEQRVLENYNFVMYTGYKINLTHVF